MFPYLLSVTVAFKHFDARVYFPFMDLTSSFASLQSVLYFWSLIIFFTVFVFFLVPIVPMSWWKENFNLKAKSSLVWMITVLSSVNSVYSSLLFHFIFFFSGMIILYIFDILHPFSFPFDFVYFSQSLLYFWLNFHCSVSCVFSFPFASMIWFPFSLPFLR